MTTNESTVFMSANQSGVQDCQDHEDIQAGQEVSGAAGHGAHSEDKLEGSGSLVHVGGDGDVGVWESALLH